MKYAHSEAGSIYKMSFIGYDSKGIPMYFGDGRYWRFGISNTDEIQFYIKNGFPHPSTDAHWQLIMHSNGEHTPFYDSLLVLPVGGYAVSVIYSTDHRTYSYNYPKNMPPPGSFYISNGYGSFSIYDSFEDALLNCAPSWRAIIFRAGDCETEVITDGSGISLYSYYMSVEVFISDALLCTKCCYPDFSSIVKILGGSSSSFQLDNLKEICRLLGVSTVNDENLEECDLMKVYLKRLVRILGGVPFDHPNDNLKSICHLLGVKTDEDSNFEDCELSNYYVKQIGKSLGVK